MKIQSLLIVLLLAICSFSCSPKKSSSSRTFVFCSEGSPTIFNPQLASDGPSFDASSEPIYNRLLDFTEGTTDLVPSLAESWKISADGKVYTLNLKKGVKFQTTPYFTPEREFNADDVVFTFKRMMDKNHPFHKVNGGGYEYFNSMSFGELISDVKKVNDYEIVITLSKPDAPFLANLAMNFMSILSQEYADKLAEENKKEELDTLPIGTGPFKFKKYVKDTLIRYEKHEDYFRGPAKIEKLVFAITPDSSVRYQKLRKGECHLIKEPAPTDLQALRADKDIKLGELSGLNVGYIAMNTEKKPFDNIKFRKAISLALNRQTYIDAIYLGNATLAKSPLPPTIWAYDKSLPEFKFDLKAAKEMIKESGVKIPVDIELWTLPVARPYNPNGKKMGEMIQEDLKAIGVNVELVSYDWPTYLAKSRKGEHQMIQLGWTGDNGDPDNFLYNLLSCAAVNGGSNVAKFCDKTYNDFILEAKIVSDKETRKNLYQKALRVFQEKRPWIPVAHANTYRAMQKEVKGFTLNPLGTDSFYKVYLSSWSNTQ